VTRRPKKTRKRKSLQVKRGGVPARAPAPAGAPSPAVASPSRARRARRWWVTMLVLALALLAGTVWLFLLYPATQGPSQGREIELVVTGTESADEIAEKLAEAGLVTGPRTFALFVRLSGGTSRFAKGTHLLSDEATPRELLARLERAPGAGHVKVTFPEGWTRFDMAKRLQEKHVCPLRGFLDRTTDGALLAELRIEGDSAEGYLFPATYDLAVDSDPADVVRRMKAEFDRRFTALEDRHGSALLDLAQTLRFGTREIVTLASMVEKEAAVDDERAVIASVFLNRLRDPDFRPKLLQCDPPPVTAAFPCRSARRRARATRARSRRPSTTTRRIPTAPTFTRACRPAPSRTRARSPSRR
jgi:UPF0755 protein